MAASNNASFAKRCFELDDPYDTCPLYSSNSSQLYAVTVGVIVANIISSPVTIVTNGIIIFVMFKTSALHTPSNVFLGNLALADFLTGFLSQPLFTASLVWEIVHGKISCTLWYFVNITGFFSSGLAFFSLTGISLERYMALFFHLRYKDVVTVKAVINSVVSIWFVSIALICLWLVEAIREVVRVLAGTVSILCFTVTCAVHLKIFKIALYHRHQIQPAQTNANSRTSQIKLAISMAYIVWIYVICYTPYLFACIYSAYLTADRCSAKQFFLLAGILTNLIAAVEPFVFCWRNCQLRVAVVDTVRRITGKSAPAPFNQS